MNQNGFKTMSLGKQGVFIHENLNPLETKRYLNLLIQNIQVECGTIMLRDITLDMANNLLTIVYDNDELFAKTCHEEEDK